MEQTPLQFAEMRRKTLLANFAENDVTKEILEKAVSSEQFQVMYADHQVYTIESLSQYAEKVAEEGLEKGMTESEIVKGIQSEFETLQSVHVKQEDSSLKKVFVRKA